MENQVAIKNRKLKTINWSQILIITILSLFALIAVTPLILAVMVSFSSGESVATQGYRLWPSEFSIESYKLLFENFGGIFKSYGVSILVTVSGVLLSLFLTILMAYPLSFVNFKYRGLVSFLIYFTMMFSGGLVACYIWTIKYLNMKNHLFTLVVTQLLMPTNVFLLRTFFSAVPKEVYESAKLDGASEFKILFKFYVPMCLPGIVAVGLFLALQYWNDYLTGMLYLDVQDLYPLQLLLYKYGNYITDMMHGSAVSEESIMFAMCIVGTLPMLVVFLFFQKYFVRGLTAGAVKS